MISVKSIADEPHHVFNEARERLAARCWSVCVEIDGREVDIEVCATDTAWASRHPDLEPWIAETVKRTPINYQSTITPAQQLRRRGRLWLRVPSDS